MYLHMYQHILIATDGSEISGKAVRQGLALAKAVGARATVITVSEPFPNFQSEFASGEVVKQHQSAQQKEAGSYLASAMKAADEIGITAGTLHVADSHPAEAILDAAMAQDCDLIVMGSHGRRGLGRLLLGSKTYEVVSHGHVPVLVVR